MDASYLRTGSLLMLAILSPQLVAKAELVTTGENLRITSNAPISGVEMIFPEVAEVRGWPLKDLGQDWQMDFLDIPVTSIDGSVLFQPQVGGIYYTRYVGFLAFGQSNAIGGRASPPLSTSQAYGNVTFPKGTLTFDEDRTAIAPLVEKWVETTIPGMANAFLELVVRDEEPILQRVPFRVFGACAGIGGPQIEAFRLNHAYRAEYCIEDAQALSVASGKSYALHAIVWIHGETDYAQNTSQAVYTSNLRLLMDQINAYARQETGQTFDPLWLIVQIHANSRGKSAICQAWDQVASEREDVFVVTPSYHVPFNPADHLHFTNLGNQMIGVTLGKAIKQILVDKRPWTGLHATTATLEGNHVVVDLVSPTGHALTWDTSIGEITDYGFLVKDSQGTLPLNSVTLVGNRVILELGRSPNGPLKVRYALDYIIPDETSVSGYIVNGGAGNLRDTDDTMIQGLVVPNWCLAFELPVTTE